MSNTTTHSYAAMEGKGAYNRHAKLPAAGAVVALPLLEKAVLRVELGSESSPSSSPIMDHPRVRTRWPFHLLLFCLFALAILPCRFRNRRLRVHGLHLHCWRRRNDFALLRRAAKALP